MESTKAFHDGHYLRELLDEHFDGVVDRHNGGDESRPGDEEGYELGDRLLNKSCLPRS